MKKYQCLDLRHRQLCRWGVAHGLLHIQRAELSVLCEDTKVIVGPLQKYERSGFFVMTWELAEWEFEPLLVFYDRDNL